MNRKSKIYLFIVIVSAVLLSAAFFCLRTYYVNLLEAQQHTVTETLHQMDSSTISEIKITAGGHSVFVTDKDEIESLVDLVHTLKLGARIGSYAPGGKAYTCTFISDTDGEIAITLPILSMSLNGKWAGGDYQVEGGEGLYLAAREYINNRP